MKLHIPELGESFVLAEPWTFEVVNDYRNASIFTNRRLSITEWLQTRFTIEPVKYDSYPKTAEEFNMAHPHRFVRNYSIKEFIEPSLGNKMYEVTFEESFLGRVRSIEVTIPAGVRLYVDRIYIRKGNKDYSSVTFRTKKDEPNKEWSSKRFFARLADVNRIMIKED